MGTAKAPGRSARRAPGGDDGGVEAESSRRDLVEVRPLLASTESRGKVIDGQEVSPTRLRRPCNLRVVTSLERAYLLAFGDAVAARVARRARDS